MSGRPPLPRTACGHCGKQKRCPRLILDKPVCDVCVLRFARTATTCPGCGGMKVLAFYDAQHRPACARCTGNKPRYACVKCGREDSQFGRKCAPCVLAERATALLSDPSGHIHPQLQPVFDTLMAGPRPQTTLYWFTRSAGPAILQAMALGQVEISHATFAAMPTNRTNTYLRDFLVAVGVLPHYDAELERVTPWLNDILATLPKDHGDTIARFARWHLLRRLNVQAHAGTLTHGAIAAARNNIIGAVRFLGWLHDRDQAITTATQADLEDYATAFPARAQPLLIFINWTASTRITHGLRMPIKDKDQPQVTLSDHDRWAQVELLLHDDTIRLYTRIGGLFTLLFAQPLARICRMRADQITTRDDGHVIVTFDTFPIELPDPLDKLVLAQLARRGQASYASRPDQWLFPGGIPGKYLATENIRSQLVARGIQPNSARKAAMFQLAGEIPTPILAEILGLSPHTATRWAALAARDWSQYTAIRHHDLQGSLQP